MDGIEDVVILCGGRGTRLQGHIRSLPKPLVEIGGRPIVWHVINLCAAQGLHRFTLCTGYRSELVEQFAATTDWPAGVEVACLRTGDDTPTGGRLKQAGLRLGRPFFAAYADGVADLDVPGLVAAHRDHRDLATVTVVRPRLQYGVAELNGDGRVRGFREKPRMSHWVNGGFFCFEPGAMDYIADNAVLEREPLERLAADGQLHAYRHRGFWECMDTYKDAVLLNDIWESGSAPWKRWD